MILPSITLICFKHIIINTTLCSLTLAYKYIMKVLIFNSMIVLLLMSDSQIYISLMAAMLSSLIFRLTICISYVFHFYFHVYSFVDFNQSSFF